jgi:hypothetical protein
VVLQQRLKQSGMRWNIETAQNLLSLKAKQASLLWHQDVELPVMRYYDAYNSINDCKTAQRWQIP